MRKAFAVALVCKTKTCRRGMATARSALRNSVDERQALGTQLSGGWWCAENTGEGGWRRERYSYKCKYVYMCICKWQCRLSKQRCIGVNCNWVAMGSSTCTCLHVVIPMCPFFAVPLPLHCHFFVLFWKQKNNLSHKMHFSAACWCRSSLSRLQLTHTLTKMHTYPNTWCVFVLYCSLMNAKLRQRQRRRHRLQYIHNTCY